MNDVWEICPPRSIFLEVALLFLVLSEFLIVLLLFTIFRIKPVLYLIHSVLRIWGSAKSCAKGTGHLLFLCGICAAL